MNRWPTYIEQWRITRWRLQRKYDWMDPIQIIYGYPKYITHIPDFLILLKQYIKALISELNSPYGYIENLSTALLQKSFFSCRVCTRRQLAPGVDGVGGILPHCQATMASNERYWRFMNMKKSICTRMWHNHHTIDGPHSSRGDWWLPGLVVMPVHQR